MKRIVSVLLFVLMILSLTGCMSVKVPNVLQSKSEPDPTVITAQAPAAAAAEAPGETPAEAPAEEPAEAPAEEPAEVPAEPERKVTIFTSRRTVMTEGETVYLTSKLEGFEDCVELQYVWNVDKGNGFEVVEGANEPTYVFPADAESLTWGWMLTVLYR